MTGRVILDSSKLLSSMKMGGGGFRYVSAVFVQVSDMARFRKLDPSNAHDFI